MAAQETTSSDVIPQLAPEETNAPPSSAPPDKPSIEASKPNAADEANEAQSAFPTLAGGITPENTVFVSLSFEGPDQYSSAGGLGTRVTEFTEALASEGFQTHLIFIGDPNLPSSEDRVRGKLRIERWGQWISKYHPNGVYDGEEGKLNDYNASAPRHVVDDIARPAIAAGKIVVVIGEDWQTAEAVSRVAEQLADAGLRQYALIMWNCNSLMSLHRIDWPRLARASTITTVSRYMKQKLWQYDVNALVIPNGIPQRFLDAVDDTAVQELRDVARRGNAERLFLFKIGRFDPDKRWIMAVEAVARLKRSGAPVTMIIRGGIEPHGADALARARALGLRVVDIEAKRPSVQEGIELLRNADDADIYNLRFFVPEEFVRLCYAAADATLANSGHEPFGLVGLEVMAARGIAFTGSTGEDYAISFENAVALETDDPEEIVGYLMHMNHHPEEREKIRAAAYRTASEFVWTEVLENLIGKLGYMARKQSLALD